jgi:hypothetical protein
MREEEINQNESTEEKIPHEGYDASDPAQVSSARKKSGRKRKAELNFVKAIMIVPEGRHWMYDMIVLCKVFTSPIVPGDPYGTYNNIGEQNIGKKLLQDINECAPEEYMLMIKEANERK